MQTGTAGLVSVPPYAGRLGAEYLGQPPMPMSSSYGAFVKTRALQPPRQNRLVRHSYPPRALCPEIPVVSISSRKSVHTGFPHLASPSFPAHYFCRGNIMRPQPQSIGDVGILAAIHRFGGAMRTRGGYECDSSGLGKYAVSPQPDAHPAHVTGPTPLAPRVTGPNRGTRPGMVAALRAIWIRSRCAGTAIAVRMGPRQDCHNSPVIHPPKSPIHRPGNPPFPGVSGRR